MFRPHAYTSCLAVVCYTCCAGTYEPHAPMFFAILGNGIEQIQKEHAASQQYNQLQSATYTCTCSLRTSSVELCVFICAIAHGPVVQVRVYVMDSNQGAAQARNTGLAQCFGDHAILLDDDVIPDSNLISAYLGAITRYPDAAGALQIESHMCP